MLRSLASNRNLSVFALFVAGLAMAAIVGLVGGNHQAAAAGECGSSYALNRTYPISNGTERTGTLELYYSNTTKKNCAINRCSGNCYQALYRSVSIRKSSSTAWTTDGGLYHTYAGPVYVYAPGSCIDAYGGVSFWDGSKYNYDGGRYAYNIMCG